MKTFSRCDCRLCKNLLTKFTEYQGVVVDDDPILFQTENFFLVPDISPVSKYHLLIVSKNHYLSMSTLPENLFDELSTLCNWVCETLLKNVGGKCFIFEHGSGKESEKKFNSINHFHLHIVNFDENLTKVVEEETNCRKIEIFTLSEIRKFINKEYIFICEYKKNFFVMLFDELKIESQLIRRIVFEYNALKSEKYNIGTYNWKKGIDLHRYKNSANVLKTIFGKN